MIGGLASSLLLTLLLVPVVYVALAGKRAPAGDDSELPHGTSRAQPSLSDAGART